MTAAHTASARRAASRLAPLAVLFLVAGLSTAMAEPFLALFLTTGLHAGPVRVTTFLTVAALSSVLASTLIGRWSDGRARRRAVIAASALAGCGGAIAMALLRDYWMLLAVKATMAAVATATLPQLFAYSRETLRGSHRTAMAMSTLRTLYSVAWVAGPPVAAVLLDVGGFRLVYLAAAAMYAIITGVALIWMRPSRPVISSPAGPGDRADTGEAPDARPATIWLTVGAFVLLQCAGSLAVQSLPLFVRSDLHGTVRESGLILGLCAALEIPLMLGFGLLTSRVPTRRLLLVGAGASVTYNVVAMLATSAWQMAAGQLLNAAAIAAIYGLGVTYMQDMLPRHAGRASTLFSNAFPAAAILAAPLLGVAQHLGYRASYVAAAILGAGGLAVLAFSGRGTSSWEAVRAGERAAPAPASAT